ncbi:proline-rich transmembrane protein 1-like isoform X2 [Littorina saxatilis]|uniref:Proline-rich transmembrane protein 1 n=1 Tax=Littorina saxatilis TaxID=31220 RepID=A0AAN9B5T5_9CAEN
MAEKQAPPSYNDAAGTPAGGDYNAGYAPPQGDQGGYPPAQNPQGGQPGNYPAQPGYPPGYGAGYGQYPPQQQGGFNPGQHQPGQHQQYQYQQNTVVMTQPTQQGMIINNVPDNMGLAIFTTICCCWPLGIVAIMRAQESRRALDRGDMLSAGTLSAESRRYSMWAIAGGCVSIVIAVIIIVVVVINMQNNTYYDY